MSYAAKVNSRDLKLRLCCKDATQEISEIVVTTP